MERFNNAPPYDPAAGPWPVEFSDEEKQTQREAGKEILQKFDEALAAGHHEFHIPEGVYRIDTVFHVGDYDGLHIRAPNVEIVAEGDPGPLHFEFLGSKNIKLSGPLTLDGDPFGFSQGTIEKTDIRAGEQSFLTVRLHPGYLVPEAKNRFICFNPETGVMIPQYQIVAEEVEDLGDGLIKVTADGNQYKPEFEAAVAVGNFICIESPNIQRGGVVTTNSANVELEDVGIHTFCLVWGLPIFGDHIFKRHRACRRPGTNRLMGGGFPQLQNHGGTCHFEDCEIAHNFDDLTNIGTELSFAFNQVSPNQLYVGMKDTPIEPGKEFTFFGAYSLEKSGTATVVEAVKNEDEGITHAFWDALKKAQCLTWDVVPWLVTLDQDIKISELEVVDISQARPKALIFINNYLHDSLASGISSKGADRIVAEGNVIQRAGCKPIGADFDPYWWEGGVPANISIVNNLILDSPSNLPDQNPAIHIYCDASDAMLKEATGTPIQSVRIIDNKIVNARISAIGLQYVEDAEIVGNTLENPMAAGLQTAHGGVCNYDSASAIFLNAVRRTTVTDNRITLEEPNLVPEVIRATSKTDKGQVTLGGNTVSKSGGSEPLPNGFYSGKIMANKQSETEGSWHDNECGGCFEARVLESREPGSKASFKWTGTRARVYGMQWKNNLGPVDFYVDERFAGTVDCSELPPRFAELIEDECLKTQLLFESAILPPGDHIVSLVIKESLGEGRGIGAGIEAFDYTDAEFAGECEANGGGNDPYQQGSDTCPANEGYKAE